MHSYSFCCSCGCVCSDHCYKAESDDNDMQRHTRYEAWFNVRILQFERGAQERKTETGGTPSCFLQDLLKIRSGRRHGTPSIAVPLSTLPTRSHSKSTRRKHRPTLPHIRTAEQLARGTCFDAHYLYIHTIQFDYYIVQKHHCKDPHGRPRDAATVGECPLPMVVNQCTLHHVQTTRTRGRDLSPCKTDCPISTFAVGDSPACTRPVTLQSNSIYITTPWQLIRLPPTCF